LGSWKPLATASDLYPWSFNIQTKRQSRHVSGGGINILAKTSTLPALS
jgi:hypothetical protein